MNRNNFAIKFFYDLCGDSGRKAGFPKKSNFLPSETL